MENKEKTRKEQSSLEETVDQITEQIEEYMMDHGEFYTRFKLLVDRTRIRLVPKEWETGENRIYNWDRETIVFLMGYDGTQSTHNTIERLSHNDPNVIREVLERYRGLETKVKDMDKKSHDRLDYPRYGTIIALLYEKLGEYEKARDKFLELAEREKQGDHFFASRQDWYQAFLNSAKYAEKKLEEKQMKGDRR